jgi:hypothetical protein
MEMLQVLAKAKDPHEFVERIPDALRVLRTCREMLLAGEVSVWDLIITKHLSKDPDKYKQMVSQVIAARAGPVTVKVRVEFRGGFNWFSTFTLRVTCWFRVYVAWFGSTVNRRCTVWLVELVKVKCPVPVSSLARFTTT